MLGRIGPRIAPADPNATNAALPARRALRDASTPATVAALRRYAPGMSLREDFQRDGVVYLPSVLTPDEVAVLAHGVAETIARPGPMALSMQPEDGSGRFFEDFCRWRDVDAFRRVILASAVGRIAGELMESDEVRLFHDHTLVKEAGSSLRTPWHQDQPYYCIDGTQTVSLWIPLDPVSRRATLEFVAGSHGGTWYMPRSFQRNTAMVFDEPSLMSVILGLAWALGKSVPAPVKRSQLVVPARPVGVRNTSGISR